MWIPRLGLIVAEVRIGEKGTGMSLCECKVCLSCRGLWRLYIVSLVAGILCLHGGCFVV